MKILFLSPRFYPDKGGVEKHVYEVASRLVSLGHDVTVASETSISKLDNSREDYQIKVEGDNEAKKIKRGVKSIQIEKKNSGAISVVRFYFGRKGKAKKIRIWMRLFKLRNFFSSFDVIHCHDVFFWYLPLRFLLPNTPVYTTFHGYEGRFPVEKKAIVIRKLSEKLTRGNICVGKYIQKWYGTNPNAVIYGGIGETKQIQVKEQKNEGVLKILFVGRLDKDTGVEIYLKALKLLRDKGINFSFTACGDGPLRERASVFGRVKGFVDDVGREIIKSDIIFSSSYLSIMEALSFGKPVIAVYDNPLKEDYLRLSPLNKFIIVKDNPISVFEVLADAVKGRKLINKRKTLEWARNQSWNRIVNKYIKLWRK